MYSINPDKLEKTFLAYEKKNQLAEKQLLTFIEQCEHAHYPSPLQLQILTHFRDISLAIELSIKRTNEFLREMNTQAIWGTSLIHGNLKWSHIFENYLINWERAHYGHAADDLINFFYHETAYYAQGEMLVDCFHAYLAINPLDNHELSYLSLYLLNVHPYLNTLTHFFTNERGSQSNAAQTVKLEHIYRRILTGIEFLGKLASFEKKSPEVED